MNKLILICLLFVIPAALGAECNNPLLSYLDITKLATSAEQTGLAYCTGLEGKDLCCSTATINTLQTTIDTLIDSLVEKAVARDTYLLTLRTSTTDGLQSYTSKFTTFQTKAKDALTAVKTYISGASEGDDTSALEDLQDAIEENGLTTIATTVSDALEEATKGLSTYQTTRATCINTLVEVQASIYCLACRTDYDTLGVAEQDEGVLVNYEFAAITSIANACYPFLVAAEKQNVVNQHYLLGAKLGALSTLMDNIKADPPEFTALELEEALEFTNPTDDASEVPTSLKDMSCTSAATCLDKIYELLLSTGSKIDEARVANGGFINYTPEGPVIPGPMRLLANSRMLSGTYDPTDEDNSAGVTVAFPEDVLDNSAWRQGGLMTCVVGLVAMLFL